MTHNTDRNNAKIWLEGDILELIDGSVWVVKGCIHPDAPIAVPRVVEGRKIKRMTEAFDVIARYYTFFIQYVPELGKKAPVVNPAWIKQMKSFLHLSRNLNITNSSKVYSTATELLRILHTECGLKCGPTGSLLGGYAGKGSDIDINCIDKPGALECLRNLRIKNILKPLPIKEFINELPSVSETLDWNHMSKLVIYRLTQGIFKGVRYTLRLINCSRLQRFLGPYTYVIRNAYVIFRITSFDYRTPSIYRVELLSPTLLPSRETYFVSHRVRFSEVPSGSIVIGRGDIMLKDNRAIVSFDTPSSKVEALMLPSRFKAFLKTQIT